MIINKTQIDLPIIFRWLWAARRKLLIWGGIAAVFGIIVAYSIPKEYVTEIQIALEDNSKSASGSLGGLAAMAGINLASSAGENALSSEVYPEIVRSSPFLYEFADVKVKHDGKQITFYQYLTQGQKGTWWGYIFRLPAKLIGMVVNNDKQPNRSGTGDYKIDNFNPTQFERLFAAGLSSRIQILTDTKKKTAKFAIQMQDPVIAAVIADTLIVKLQKYMTNYKTSKTREDLDVKMLMLREAQRKYYTADSLYAKMADQNQNILLQSAKLKLERLENEKTIAFTVYQQLASQVEFSKVKLQEESAIATIIEPPVVAIGPISPNKKMILIAFVFLGVVGASASVLIRKIFLPKRGAV